MLTILSGVQVKALDANHIHLKGISSLELMERAATGFVDWWRSREFEKENPVHVFCGAGNNGGDGFAIARLLHQSDFQVQVYKCFEDSYRMSGDALKNFHLLPEEIELKSWKEFESKPNEIVIDCFLGVGFQGELRSEAQEIISKINSFRGMVISVDIPSGIPADEMLKGTCVKADYTVTFAFPKLSLLFPEHGQFTGELVLVDIGIGDEEYLPFESPYFFLRKKDITGFHQKYSRFSHKGDFGKVFIIAGSIGKMGAAILSAMAALRSGSGLVTALIPESERHIFQIALPEAMCQFELPFDFSGYDAIGLGPGMGFEKKAELLKTLFESYRKPMVLDADAITLLGEHPELLPLLPKGSILTPHLKEFDRILGKTDNHKERLHKAAQFCKKWNLNLLIKGANSVICLADGRQIFNSTGTSYMATAGSGDVLTGMITSFLGQGYSPEAAMICGVYQHGLAGEIAGKAKRRGTIASDIVGAIPKTYSHLDIS
jgi:ADP-dependent NAD(P)H-hydrate dehydratase / NAD(P)H-hydrate epimerase